MRKYTIIQSSEALKGYAPENVRTRILENERRLKGSGSNQISFFHYLPLSREEHEIGIITI